jgi:release factor glutamine methyltransferase
LNALSQHLHTAQQQLIQALALPAATARIEAQALLRAVIPTATLSWLIAHANDGLTPAQQDEFAAFLQRRLHGEPIAYIVGIREFYGLEFKVSPDVLIPRPDTETLVEGALAKIPATQRHKILDMGTGSGAIAISIALQRPQAHVTAIDVSVAALDVAAENMRRLAVDNLILLQSDWFGALGEEKFDVIVSNPPYIAEKDTHLVEGDLRFEPLFALASGKDGLDSLRHITAIAPRYLNAQGWLLLEHGFNQAAAVVALLAQAGFVEIQSLPDLAGVLRVTMGQVKQPAAGVNASGDGLYS